MAHCRRSDRCRQSTAAGHRRTTDRRGRTARSSAAPSGDQAPARIPQRARRDVEEREEDIGGITGHARAASRRLSTDGRPATRAVPATVPWFARETRSSVRAVGHHEEADVAERPDVDGDLERDVPGHRRVGQAHFVAGRAVAAPELRPMHAVVGDVEDFVADLREYGACSAWSTPHRRARSRPCRASFGAVRRHRSMLRN